MKTLVAYMSTTGNTRKVAEAIYGALDGEKELSRAQDVLDWTRYDLAFLGFPTHAAGPDGRARRILAQQAAGKQLALFTTHGSPAGSNMGLKAAEGFRQACGGAEVLGVFECQGKIPGVMAFAMGLAPDPGVKRNAREYKADLSAHAQPNPAALARAAARPRENVVQAGDKRTESRIEKEGQCPQRRRVKRR